MAGFGAPSGNHQDIFSYESGFPQALTGPANQDRGVGNLENVEKMTYEQPQYEIETSVFFLGLAYAVSLISLIFWVAC
jgi:hypothetical protein